MQKKGVARRLDYTGSLKPVVDRLCDFYGIGKPNNFSVVEVGYEDCNIAIRTRKGKYLAKIFSKVRTPEDVDRYAEIMRRVVDSGVNHPELTRAKNGDIIYRDRKANGIHMVLMRFVEGKTFLELDRSPDTDELGKVLEQAAMINRIDYQPPYLFDSWAIPNIRLMFDRVQQFISPEDMKLVGEAIFRYDRIPVTSLPHCLVHGDFTKANVIRGDDGQLYILDFSVANWYPRIQELAVITANLLFDKNDSMSLQVKSEMVASEYAEFNPLTEEEKKYLYPYTLAGVAMEFMGSHQERFIKGNNSEETKYWFNLGREGLRRALL